MKEAKTPKKVKGKYFQWVLLALHLIVQGFYVLILSAKKIDLSVLYFCSEGFFFISGMMGAMNADIWAKKQAVLIHCAFIFFRTIIYFSADTGVFLTGNKARLILLCVFSIVIVLPLFLKCYFYGYFNEKNNNDRK